MKRQKMISVDPGRNVERARQIALLALVGLCLISAAFLGSVLWQLWRGGPGDLLEATGASRPPQETLSSGKGKGGMVIAPQMDGVAGATRMGGASHMSGWIFKKPWQRVNPATEGASAPGGAAPGAPPSYQSNYSVKGIVFGAGPPVVILAEKNTGRIINAMVGETVGDEEVVQIRASYVILRRGSQEASLELP